MKHQYMYDNTLYIASDHGGHSLKKRLVRYAENELNIKIKDLGPHEYDETDDYPDYVIPLAKKVAAENAKKADSARGIVICKNGIGVSIAANKIPGIRAGVGYNIEVAESMVRDDNTNVLALAATTLSEDHAMAITKRWLETEFSRAKRHVRRLEKITELEK